MNDTHDLDRFTSGIDVGEHGSATQPRSDASGERQPWQFATDDPAEYNARVLVDPGHAAWARHHLGDSAVVVEHPDGTIEVELEVTNIAAFRSLVLSMFDAAEVLSPPELRDDMISWLEAQAQ